MASLKETPREWFGRMIDEIKNNNSIEVRRGFIKFNKHRKQLLQFKDRIDGHNDTTLLHYALRKNASDDIITILLEYPYDESAKSDGQTYYDIALDQANLFALERFSSLEEKTHIQNDIVPAVKSAIKENKLDDLEDILKQRKYMLLFTFTYEKFRNIFLYAIHVSASPAIITLLLKYAQLYNVKINKDMLYTNAYNINASNNILKLLEPANIINNEPLRGVKVNNTAPVNTLANRFLSNYAIRDIDGLKVLTLLKGTILFNAFNIMKPEDIAANEFAAYHNANNIYLQLLNGILPLSTTISHTDTTIKIKSCIDRNAPKFFYANPAGGPALGEVHGIFNTLAAFELKQDINVVVLMTPANQHRLEGHDHDAIYKCTDLADEYGSKYCKCSFTHETCPYAAPYDVCIKPSFLKKHNIHGHIAIAEADSFNEKMQTFYNKFNENDNIPERYKKINNAIFKYCVSEDKHVTHSSSSQITYNNIIGFPEIVLQLYGSQWYSESSDTKQMQVYEQQFEKEIPIEDGDIPKTIVKYLLNVDTSKLFKNSLNPLQLKYVATTRAFYNLTNGNIIQNPFMKDAIYSEIMKESPTYFYLNYLKAYFNHEIDFFLDPRTGFFMNSKADITFLYNNNNEREKTEKFKRIQLRNYIEKYIPNNSLTLFEKSARLRKHWIPVISYDTLSYPHTFDPNKFDKLFNANVRMNLNILKKNTSNNNTSNNNTSNNLSNILGPQSGGVITQKHRRGIQPSIQKKTHHKTLRNIMKRKKPLSTILQPSIRVVNKSKFTTLLWVDQEYMKICQIIKAYL